ncbi:hypothetical protein ACIA49_39170 [Kribbella sp. NPDC051587]|uniref:hypothetical protein n=1 Tax=Kribbella sp. NPDC051587 TaxID=3364119 RepID=UPI0037B81E7C
MTSTLQLDLFGEVEAAENTREHELAWLARFQRVPAVLMVERKGEIVGENRWNQTAWLCPDPDCGRVETRTELLISIHGFDPFTPGHAPSDGRCVNVAHYWAKPHALAGAIPQADGRLMGYCTCGNFTHFKGDCVADLEAEIDGHRRYIARRLAAPAGPFATQTA